jgi:murein DD-endopeptidase MepM/ murein hydrolase activator NlpD
MGATGNVTGIHLHLELSTTMAWNYDTFLNPSIALGIPNERGTIVKYDGSAPPPEPPEPTPEEKKKRKFPFVLYARKLRNR